MRTFLAILLSTSVVSLYGQVLDRIPLKVVLERYQGQGIHFSYDAQLVESASVEAPEPGMPLDSFLSMLQKSTPFVSEYLKEGYYTLTVPLAGYTLSVLDSIDVSLILTDHIILLVNGIPIRSIGTEGGSASFEYRPDGADRISLKVLGYNQKPIPLADLLSSKHLVIRVSPEVLELSSVLVEDYLTTGIDLDPADQSISISVRDLPLLPGETDGDLFASLAALPGVTTPDNRPGNLFIRGSTTDQSLILFDDIPIYHRGHYYGTISPYNPKMVDEVNVYRNGFHPRFGGRVGGAVEIKSTENLSTRSAGGIGTNTLYGTGYVKLPLAENTVGLAISGRHSYPVSFQSPKLEALSKMVFAGSTVIDSAGNFPEKFDVDFQDYTARVEWRINSSNELNFTALYARTDIRFDVAGIRLPEHNGFHNTGFNLKWRSTWSERARSLFSATSSEYNFSFDILHDVNTPANAPRNFAHNSIRDLSLSEEVSLKLNPNHQLQIGGAYTYQKASYDYNNRTPQSPQTVTSAGETHAHTVSPFLNLQSYIGKKWFFQAGMRATYYDPLQNMKVEPRISTSYDLSNQWILKGAAGAYYQYLSQAKLLEFTSGGFENEVWLLADKGTARIIRGTQSMLGAIWSKKHWVIDVEGYLKTAENVTYYTGRRFSNSDTWTSADHTMYGVDVFLKRRIGESVSVWSGYTFSKIDVVLDTAREIRHPSKYSQPHACYLGGSINKGNFKCSIGWKYASGLYARSLDILVAEQIFLQNEDNGGGSPDGGPPPTNPFASIPKRYDPIHMLDVSVSYSLPRTENRPFESTIGLSVINGYNQTNLTDQVVRAAGVLPDFAQRNAMKFAPNLMVMLEF